jgi:hypothetical protein
LNIVFYLYVKMSTIVRYDDYYMGSIVQSLLQCDLHYILNTFKYVNSTFYKKYMIKEIPHRARIMKQKEQVLDILKIYIRADIGYISCAFLFRFVDKQSYYRYKNITSFVLDCLTH